MLNELETKNFLELVLPKLRDDEVFIFMVFARKKYNPLVTDDWVSFKDIIKTNDIEEIIIKIKRAQSFLLDFKDFKTKKEIASEAFVFYIDLNPKSTIKAFTYFSKNMLDLLYQVSKDPSKSKEMRNIKNKLLSAIHKNNSYKPFYLIDIDKKDEQILDFILDLLNNNYKWVSETRGGYHIILEKTKETMINVFEKIIKKKQQNILPEFFNVIELKSDVMTPIVGTLQGGFEVKKYKREE